MVTGTSVYCVVCHKRKAPRGRSVPIPMANLMCDSECPGHYLDPQVGHLWPSETAEEFGYPVPAYGSDKEDASA